MMRLLMLLCLPVSLMAAPLSESDAGVYLEKVAASRPRDAATTVHFRETKTSPMLTKPTIAEGELAFQPPARFRRETSGASGSLMVSNGETLWIYYPAFQEVEKYSLKASGAEAFRGLMAAFNLQDVSRLFRFTVESVGEGHRVTLVPKRRSEKRLFDALVLEIGADLKLRRASWASPDGERTEMTFSGEKRAGAIDFDFKPPAGVHVATPLGR